jgi:hypothetical protein
VFIAHNVLARSSLSIHFKHSKFCRRFFPPVLRTSRGRASALRRNAAFRMHSVGKGRTSNTSARPQTGATFDLEGSASQESSPRNRKISRRVRTLLHFVELLVNVHAGEQQ